MQDEKQYYFYYKCRACKMVYECGSLFSVHPAEFMPPKPEDLLIVHRCHSYGEGSYGVADLVGFGMDREPKCIT